MAAYCPVLTRVTCRLIAKNQDQLWNPTLDNRVWAAFTFLYQCCLAANVLLSWLACLVMVGIVSQLVDLLLLFTGQCSTTGSYTSLLDFPVNFAMFYGEFACYLIGVG